MALQHVLEKLSGSDHGGWSLPVFVYDDGTPPAEVTVDDVIAHINAAGDIPIDINGTPDDGDPQVQQLSKSGWRVMIKYRVASMRPLHPPSAGDSQRFEINFQLPRKYIGYAPEVSYFTDPDIYPNGGFSWRGLVNVQQDAKSGAVTHGIWLDPPPVSFTTWLTVAPGTVTASWVRTLAAAIQAGTVNSAPLQGGAYAAGELLIVNCFGHLASPYAFSIKTGWSWALNVTGESRDGVDSIAYQGQDFVWNWSVPEIDRNNAELGQRIAAVYVSQVRPRGDLSALGLLPP